MKRITVSVQSIKVNAKKLRKLSSVKVKQYMHDYDCGDQFPPIQVDDCGGFYTVFDGRHRYQAQLAVGYAVIDVLVR